MTRQCAGEFFPPFEQPRIERVNRVHSSNLPVQDQTDSGIKLMEEERRRVARELHDGPAQSLTNISMRLDAVQRLFRTNPEMAQNELARINSRVVDVVNDVRRLIHDLRPLAIDEVGLVSATRELCDRCAREWGLSIAFTAENGTLSLSPAKQVALYRLVQEILNNVHKHAEASCVSITIRRESRRIVLHVTDDGKGFDPAAVPAGHYGLLGMRERAQYMGGDLTISSSPGAGSEFVIAIAASGPEPVHD